MKRRVLTLQALLGPAEGRVSSLPLSKFPSVAATPRTPPEANGGIPGSSILQLTVTFSQKGNFTVTNIQWKKNKNILLNNSGSCGALGMCSTCFQTDFELMKQYLYIYLSGRRTSEDVPEAAASIDGAEQRLYSIQTLRRNMNYSDCILLSPRSFYV